ncbi:MAG: hypothetical protein WD431_06590, partial [Cyclobacteriaceae bacterium]
MKRTRRFFLKLSGLMGFGLLSKPYLKAHPRYSSFPPQDKITEVLPSEEENNSIIGVYGDWASGLMEGKLPSHSFRRKEYDDLQDWKNEALPRANDRISKPDL